MANKSKNFKRNLNQILEPAIQFVSQPTQTKSQVQEERLHTEIPGGCKVNPLYVETRSRRMQLLLQPSLYDKLKQQANQKGESVNGLVNSLLEDALQKEI
jgi:hypothetical protein